MGSRNIVNGKTFRFGVQPIVEGTADAGGASTLDLETLAGSTPGTDDVLNRHVAVIVAGAGLIGERRLITAFDVAAGDRITVDRPWTTLTDATTQYKIFLALTGDPFIGTAQGGSAAAKTLQLADSEPNVDDFFSGLKVEIVEGPGNGESALIENYAGGSRTCILSRGLSVNPTVATKYVIQGHLYFPCNRLLIQADTGNVRVSTTHSGLAWGVYNDGPSVNENDFSDFSYVELIGKTGAITAQIFRGE